MANVQGLDQKFNEKLQPEVGAKEYAQTQKEVNGLSAREQFMKNVPADGAPTESADIVETEMDDLGPGKVLYKEIEEVTEAKAQLPKGMPATARQGWKTFSTSERVLKGVNIAIGIAFTVAMSIDLKSHWEDYNDAGKALNVVQVVVQGLTVLVTPLYLSVMCSFLPAFWRPPAA
jgi:hypothetical protein